MFTESISFSTSFAAGLLSFMSPCILPLIPAYFSFITGLSIDELTATDQREIKQKVFLSTLAYVTGFSFIFILLGASASFIGRLTSDYLWLVRYLGGGIIMIFGLHLIGIINIKAFQLEKRIHFKKRPIHLFGTFTVGMAFGAGWSPCIGPILGSILIVAGNQNTIWEGIYLLAFYAAGMALPFIIISIFIHSMLKFIKRAIRLIWVLNKISGGLLILISLLLIFDKFNIFINI